MNSEEVFRFMDGENHEPRHRIRHRLAGSGIALLTGRNWMRGVRIP